MKDNKKKIDVDIRDVLKHIYKEKGGTGMNHLEVIEMTIKYLQGLYDTSYSTHALTEEQAKEFQNEIDELEFLLNYWKAQRFLNK